MTPNNDYAFADVIRSIISHSGEQVIQNEEQTIAMFSDLAPQLKRECELLKQFYRCSGPSTFLNARSMPAHQHNAQRKRVAEMLMENYWVAEGAAYYVCEQFWYAVTGQKVQSSHISTESKRAYRQAVALLMEGKDSQAFSFFEKAGAYIPAMLMLAYLNLTKRNAPAKAADLWSKVEATDPATTWITIGQQLDQARMYSEALAYFLAAGQRTHDGYGMFLASKIWVKKGSHGYAVSAIRQSAKMGCTQARAFQDKLAAWPPDVVRSHAYTDETPV